MSHTTSIAGMKITDVAALKSAVAELAASGVNCSLVEGQIPRSYPGNPMSKADFVLKLPGSRFDVGFYKQADGTYEPQSDFYDGGVEGIIGAKASAPERAAQARIGKLLQMYGIHATTNVARKKGWTLRRVTGENGAVKLRVAVTN